MEAKPKVESSSEEEDSDEIKEEKNDFDDYKFTSLLYSFKCKNLFYLARSHMVLCTADRIEEFSNFLDDMFENTNETELYTIDFPNIVEKFWKQVKYFPELSTYFFTLGLHEDLQNLNTNILLEIIQSYHSILALNFPKLQAIENFPVPTEWVDYISIITNPNVTREILVQYITDLYESILEHDELVTVFDLTPPSIIKPKSTFLDVPLYIISTPDKTKSAKDKMILENKINEIKTELPNVNSTIHYEYILNSINDIESNFSKKNFDYNENCLHLDAIMYYIKILQKPNTAVLSNSSALIDILTDMKGEISVIPQDNQKILINFLMEIISILLKCPSNSELLIDTQSKFISNFRDSNVYKNILENKAERNSRRTSIKKYPRADGETTERNIVSEGRAKFESRYLEIVDYCKNENKPNLLKAANEINTKVKINNNPNYSDYLTLLESTYEDDIINDFFDETIKVISNEAQEDDELIKIVEEYREKMIPSLEISHQEILELIQNLFYYINERNSEIIDKIPDEPDFLKNQIDDRSGVEQFIETIKSHYFLLEQDMEEEIDSEITNLIQNATERECSNEEIHSQCNNLMIDKYPDFHSMILTEIRYMDKVITIKYLDYLESLLGEKKDDEFKAIEDLVSNFASCRVENIFNFNFEEIKITIEQEIEKFAPNLKADLELIEARVTEDNHVRCLLIQMVNRFKYLARAYYPKVLKLVEAEIPKISSKIEHLVNYNSARYNKEMSNFKNMIKVKYNDLYQLYLNQYGNLNDTNESIELNKETVKKPHVFKNTRISKSQSQTPNRKPSRTSVKRSKMSQIISRQPSMKLRPKSQPSIDNISRSQSQGNYMSSITNHNNRGQSTDFRSRNSSETFTMNKPGVFKQRRSSKMPEIKTYELVVQEKPVDKFVSFLHDVTEKSHYFYNSLIVKFNSISNSSSTDPSKTQIHPQQKFELSIATAKQDIIYLVQKYSQIIRRDSVDENYEQSEADFRGYLNSSYPDFYEAFINGTIKDKMASTDYKFKTIHLIRSIREHYKYIINQVKMDAKLRSFDELIIRKELEDNDYFKLLKNKVEDYVSQNHKDFYSKFYNLFKKFE